MTKVDRARMHSESIQLNADCYSKTIENAQARQKGRERAHMNCTLVPIAQKWARCGTAAITLLESNRVSQGYASSVIFINCTRIVLVFSHIRQRLKQQQSQWRGPVSRLVTQIVFQHSPPAASWPCAIGCGHSLDMSPTVRLHCDLPPRNCSLRLVRSVQ